MQDLYITYQYKDNEPVTIKVDKSKGRVRTLEDDLEFRYGIIDYDNIKSYDIRLKSYCECCGKETDILSRYHNLNMEVCDNCLRKLLNKEGK